MRIKSDSKLNRELQKEVISVRGGMLSQVKKEQSERFVIKPSNSTPATIIMDKATGRCVEVPLFASREVLVALNTLFP
jgi:hypothetical protein